MRIMVYSSLWVMQDFVHQPKDIRNPTSEALIQAWLLARQDRGIERNQITFDLNRKSARCFEV